MAGDPVYTWHLKRLTLRSSLGHPTAAELSYSKVDVGRSDGFASAAQVASLETALKMCC